HQVNAQRIKAERQNVVAARNVDQPNRTNPKQAKVRNTVKLPTVAQLSEGNVARPSRNITGGQVAQGKNALGGKNDGQDVNEGPAVNRKPPNRPDSRPNRNDDNPRGSDQ